MQINKFFVCSLVTACVVLPACTSDNIEIPKSELYAREFVKQFGVVDPNHDWNNATQGSVTVITSSPTHVEVLADIHGERYIFADYHNVNGKEDIKFTIPKGASELIVTLDGQQFKTQIGGTVDGRNRSRAIWDKTHDGVVAINRGEYRTMLDKTILSYNETLPEGADNRGKVTQNFVFESKGTGNFILFPAFWNTGGWNTLGIYYIDETKNEMVYVPFYTNKIVPVDDTKGNLLYTYGDQNAEALFPAKTYGLKDENNPWIIELDPTKYNNTGKNSFIDFQDNDWATFKRRWIKEKRSNNYLDTDTPNKYFDLSEMRKFITDNNLWSSSRITDFFYTNIVCHAHSANSIAVTSISFGAFDDWIYPGEKPCSSPNGDVRPSAWKSRGINIYVKPGTRFGMYIRAWYTADPEALKPSIDLVDIIRLPIKSDGQPEKDQYRRFHSNSKYNNYDLWGNGQFRKNHVHAATYLYEAPSGKYRVLGFEDAIDNDLNDMIFFITSNDPNDMPELLDEDNPTPPAPTPKKYEWLIAAEDLGGSYDWDFNDLVASISLLSTNTPATTAEGDAGTGSGDETTNPYVAVEITPLASGGTMPIYLMYTGDLYENGNTTATNGNFIIGKEFHKWFGTSTSQPVNVYKGSENSPQTASSVTINMPQSFTLCKNDKYNANGSQNNMGGFWVLVVDKDGEYNPAITDGAQYTKVEDSEIYNKQSITTIGSPNDDKTNVAPQMICVGEEWYWPLETHNITLAYPHDNDENPTTGFKGWLTNPTIEDEWYTTGTKVEDHLFMRKKI